jgi:segregation and condensation protein A
VYNIKLQDFEGPLDLLLFFIKRDELDIYNIPIARITKEFLEYVHYMELLDLEIAGEFVVMAAELMQIKVRMLLPPEAGEESDEDPRANLVGRLVEYKRFKEAGGSLAVLEHERRQVFERGSTAADPKLEEPLEEIDRMGDVTLFDLIASFKFAIEQMPRKFVHEIIKVNVTIDEQIAYLKEFFARRSEATFYELIKDMDEKIRVVVTFLALLELIRGRTIMVKQKVPFGDVSIMRAVS